jgi:hypothetical protein
MLLEKPMVVTSYLTYRCIYRNNYNLIETLIAASTRAPDGDWDAKPGEPRTDDETAGQQPSSKTAQNADICDIRGKNGYSAREWAEMMLADCDHGNPEQDEWKAIVMLMDKMSLDTGIDEVIEEQIC